MKEIPKRIEHKKGIGFLTPCIEPFEHEGGRPLPILEVLFPMLRRPHLSRMSYLSIHLIGFHNAQ